MEASTPHNMGHAPDALVHDSPRAPPEHSRQQLQTPEKQEALSLKQFFAHRCPQPCAA